MLLWFTALIKHASWLILHNRKNIKKGRRANKSNLKKSELLNREHRPMEKQHKHKFW